MLHLAQQAETAADAASQTPTPPHVFDVITQIFSKGDALAQPTNLITAVQNLSMVWAIIFLIVGVLCLFNGYKFYKAFTISLALLLGVIVGYAMGKRIDAEWIVAGCMGALLATLCVPLMKYAVAILGGLAGAFIGANAWSAIAQLAAQPGEVTAAMEAYWIGALVGLLVFGMLAFILFKFSVVTMTSVSGATFVVIGVLALLLQLPSIQSAVAQSVKAHGAIIPMLVLVPALIGLILQQSNSPAEKKPA